MSRMANQRYICHSKKKRSKSVKKGILLELPFWKASAALTVTLKLGLISVVGSAPAHGCHS